MRLVDAIGRTLFAVRVGNIYNRNLHFIVVAKPFMGVSLNDKAR